MGTGAPMDTLRCQPVQLRPLGGARPGLGFKPVGAPGRDGYNGGINLMGLTAFF